ncbi:hypothetical protein B6I21_02215 [candidate division KSB1 bacterium 4572_119]|nr:MAG: hypothetical protein B6I21_02215 [candidate division KSB1 bacterium 4572_119]
MAILAKTKIGETLEKHPELKNILKELSPKFKKLDNPVIFKMVSKWATFSDVARIGGLSICELLHTLNEAIGTEEELSKYAPECIKEKEQKISDEQTPDWVKDAKQVILMDVRERDDFFLPEVLSAINRLEEKQVLLVINSFYPAPLINMLEEKGNKFYYQKESGVEHRLHIKGERIIVNENWLEEKESFEIVDVRKWKEDPFSELIKKANETPLGDGFRLIQKFVPTPLINMIEPLGYETFVEEKGMFEHHIYFYHKHQVQTKKIRVGDRIPLVIQSATPVVYPIIMKLLQSPELMSRIKIEELKIWDKTEKHLGWIVNNKADISFTAVAAVAKLYQKGLDVKLKSIVVWDNFYLLTRGYKAENFGDLKGHKIYLPLIKAAPPYAVTTFLMKKMGFNPDEFEFAFGDPFGRPEEIKKQFASGEIDTALLREPEASFALYEAGQDGQVSIAYKDLWEQIYPGKGNLPNAGVLFKGEILREYPDLADLFLQETAKAVEWVKANPKESAKISYDIMGVTPEEAELFLSRVNLNYKKSEDVLDNVSHYLHVLNQAGYGKKEFGDIKDLFV